MIAESSKVSAHRLSTQSQTAPKKTCEHMNWWVRFDGDDDMKSFLKEKTDNSHENTIWSRKKPWNFEILIISSELMKILDYFSKSSRLRKSVKFCSNIFEKDHFQKNTVL